MEYEKKERLAKKKHGRGKRFTYYNQKGKRAKKACNKVTYEKCG